MDLSVLSAPAKVFATQLLTSSNTLLSLNALSLSYKLNTFCLEGSEIPVELFCVVGVVSPLLEVTGGV